MLAELNAADSLVPPEDMMRKFDGTKDASAFKALAQGMLHGYLLPHGRLEPIHTVLDIGCGIGKLAFELSAFLKDGGRYFGFDVQPVIVEWCQVHYRHLPNFQFDFSNVISDHYNPNGSVRAEDFLFPHDDATIDVAYAGSLFTHIGPDASANYFRQAARVLKPGGRIVATCALINEHNLGLPAKAAERQRSYTRASPRHHVLDPEVPSRAVAYDENAFRKIIGEAGLIVSTILFGRWANGEAVVPGFQDCIIALKPKL